uniref:F-box domain-containing protein n=1 Tax=Clastoptera arizonana TaxID=38151 RepID=A0A1B6CKE6_9HEMI
MDERNGDCFPHHEEFYAPLNTSDSEHDCLKEFLLEPSSHEQNLINSAMGYGNGMLPLPMPMSSGSSSHGLQHMMQNQSMPHQSVNQMNHFVNSQYHLTPPGQNMVPPVQSLVQPMHNMVQPILPIQNLVQPIQTLSQPVIQNMVQPVQNMISPIQSVVQPVQSLVHPSQNMMHPNQNLVQSGLNLAQSPQSLAQTVPNLVHPMGQDSVQPLVHELTKPLVEDMSQVHPPAFQSPGHSVDKLPSVVDNGNVVTECSAQNGEAWSPGSRTGDCVEESGDAGASVRTVSSDCVSSETVCSPEGESVIEDKPTQKRRKRKTTHQPRQRNTTKTTYQSQISPDQNGIKIRIRKSLTLAPHRPRKRKSKEPIENDISDEEPAEQSVWADKIPEHVLYNIFYMVTKMEGCVPFLVRMSRVCQFWRQVAVTPSLWYHVDLGSTWGRDRAKNDLKFQWLCENRFAEVQELNLSGWSFTGIPTVLDKLANSCTKLQGLGLAGLQGLSSENIKFLITNCQLLQRLDLSSINPELNNPRSAVSMASLVNLAQTMGERLTHLILSNNKLAGVPQVISAIASHCPNLEVLDLANVRTVAQTTAYLHIENLQAGCSSLRVLRITNSQLALSPIPLKEQAVSQGFPNLEELSVAGVLDGFTSQPFIDDEALQRIIKSSHKLRLLDVRGCNKVSDSSLVRIPAWDLEHIFLSGCYVTRVNDSGLELIVQKWSHSLMEVDLAWSTATGPLDAAVQALADQKENSPLKILNLCGSSVSLEPVRNILLNCPQLYSLNLSSCRALPRGMKRLYEGEPLVELRALMLKDDKTESDE